MYSTSKRLEVLQSVRPAVKAIDLDPGMDKLSRNLSALHNDTRYKIVRHLFMRPVLHPEALSLWTHTRWINEDSPHDSIDGYLKDLMRLGFIEGADKNMVRLTDNARKLVGYMGLFDEPEKNPFPEN
jgi:hypothetical protein